jgi:hypothetical protein
MREESSYFRRRAAECRELAKAARDKVSRRELDDIADELMPRLTGLMLKARTRPKPCPPFS